MYSPPRKIGTLAASLLLAGVIVVSVADSAAQQVATIRSVKVVNQGSNFQLEIAASQPVKPSTQVITGPDRLVIDFPNAVPGRSLRPLTVRTGQVRGVRMGLFESAPPVARVVLDLNGPQPYQVSPSGNKVIVKLVSGGAQPAVPTAATARVPVASASNMPAAAPVAAPVAPQPPQPHAEISLQGGKLSIRSDRARLADILHEVQRRTGASLIIPPGAGQEAVITQLGPAPVREVLSKLLDGSGYNVVLVGSGHDWSSITSIILTSKGGEGEDLPANFSARASDDATPAAAPPPPEPPAPDPPPPSLDSQPDQQAPPSETPPDAPPPPDATGQPPQ